MTELTPYMRTVKTDYRRAEVHTECRIVPKTGTVVPNVGAIRGRLDVLQATPDCMVKPLN